jgi:hypothetical protein
MISQCKDERPAEIHKQIVAVYGNVMNQLNVTKWCCEFSEGRTDVCDEQRSGRPSLISDDLAFGGTLDQRCHFKHISLKAGSTAVKRARLTGKDQG